ncbi:unnamed protein product, partial [Pylaiella littoralis]
VGGPVTHGKVKDLLSVTVAQKSVILPLYAILQVIVLEVLLRNRSLCCFNVLKGVCSRSHRCGVGSAIKYESTKPFVPYLNECVSALQQVCDGASAIRPLTTPQVHRCCPATVKPPVFPPAGDFVFPR